MLNETKRRNETNHDGNWKRTNVMREESHEKKKLFFKLNSTNSWDERSTSKESSIKNETFPHFIDSMKIYVECNEFDVPNFVPFCKIRFKLSICSTIWLALQFGNRLYVSSKKMLAIDNWNSFDLRLHILKGFANCKWNCKNKTNISKTKCRWIVIKNHKKYNLFSLHLIILLCTCM